MSCAVDESCAGIAPAMRCIAYSDAAQRQRRRPRPAPSATTSRTSARCSSRISGSAAILPYGCLRERRDRVVRAVDQQLGPQLGHARRPRSVTGTSALAEQRRPARCSCSATAGSCARLGIDRADHQVAAAEVLHDARLGHRGGDVDDRRHDCWARGGAIVGAFSTPFCRLSTSASARRCGAIARATPSVSVDLTQNSTRSASRTAATSVLASSAPPRRARPCAAAGPCRGSPPRGLRGRSASPCGRRARASRRSSCRRRRRRPQQSKNWEPSWLRPIRFRLAQTRRARLEEPEA